MWNKIPTIHLANGEQAVAFINGISPTDGSGYVLVHGREIKVGRLAAPYEFLGYGVSISKPEKCTVSE